MPRARIDPISIILLGAGTAGYWLARGTDAQLGANPAEPSGQAAIPEAAAEVHEQPGPAAGRIVPPTRAPSADAAEREAGDHEQREGRQPGHEGRIQVEYLPGIRERLAREEIRQPDQHAHHEPAARTR